MSSVSRLATLLRGPAAWRLTLAAVCLAFPWEPARAARAGGAAEPPRSTGPAAITAAAPEERQRIRQLLSEAKYAEAEAAARALLEEMIAKSGPQSFDAAKAMDLLATSMRRGGKGGDPETRALIDRSLAIKERVFGPDHIEMARTLNGLAILLQVLGDYPEARRREEHAVRIAEAALGPDHVELGNFLNNQAAILQDLGASADAIPIHRRVLAIWEKAYGAEHPDVAASIDNLANAYAETGDYAAARPLYERALAIREKSLGSGHPSVASSLVNLGNLMATLGDHAVGRGLYERAIAVIEKSVGAEHPAMATILNNYAASRREAGDYVTARSLYERILEVHQLRLGPDHPLVAQDLYDLALLRIRTGEAVVARPLLERALTIREKAVGDGHPAVGQTLNSLANTLFETGKGREAEPLYRRALRILEAALGPDHPDVAVTLSDLSVLEFAQGHHAAALKEALRAEAISRRRFQATARSLSEGEALRYAAVRTSSLDTALSTLTADRPPRESADAAVRVLDEVVRSRSMILDEMGTRHRSLAGRVDPTLGPLAAELNASRAALARLLVQGPDPEDPAVHRRAFDIASTRVERAERALAEASREFRRQVEVGRSGLEAVRQALPPGCALVSYVLYDQLASSPKDPPSGPLARPSHIPSYVAFVTMTDAPGTRVVPLGPACLIEDLVGAWRRHAGASPPPLKTATRRSEEEARAAGERLRRMIWDPVASALIGARLVLVVPDGSLALVNLAALPADPDHYLVETAPAIHLLSAERDVLRNDDIVGGVTNLLVVGDPDYDATPTTEMFAELRSALAAEEARPSANPREVAVYRGPRSQCIDVHPLRFPPLPRSGREVAEIAAFWQKRADREPDKRVVALSGSAASEATFKALAPRHGVLHLATHGFFLEGDCASKAWSTRGTETGSPPGADAPEPPARGPMLLSGLALAGANRREHAGPVGDEEDGVLTAEEIAALDLSRVQWAVLSACDTGVGRVQAGEIFGLRRAFHVAGARTLIMSLWSVEDAAARDWMKRLYQERLAGASTAEAVRRAHLETLASRRRGGRSTHPFFWGAFVAAGDWR